MSIINATIVVQAFHFFIAYLLIRYCFFKPVVIQIQAEDAHQESLIAMVQAHQQLVAQKERELVDQWNGMRRYFAQHTPSLKPELFITQRPSMVTPQFDAQEIAHAAEQLEKELLQRIRHVGN